MTWPDGTWPSVPKCLAAALFDEVGAGSTRLSYPIEFPSVLIRRVGGQDDGMTDRARVDVVVIHEDEESAEHLAERIRAYLVNTSPIRGAGLLLDGAQTEVAPYQVFVADSANPDHAQFIATYVVESRRF